MGSLYQFWDSLRRDVNTFAVDGFLSITLVFVIGDLEIWRSGFQIDLLRLAMGRCVPFSVYMYFEDIEILCYVRYIAESHTHFHLTNASSSYSRYIPF